MTDLLEELQAIASSDPRMDLLGRILGLALAEAQQLADQNRRPRQTV
jgi:hypothetical protein